MMKAIFPESKSPEIRILLNLLSLFMFFSLWYWISRIYKNELFLPTPLQVFSRFKLLIGDRVFLSALIYTSVSWLVCFFISWMSGIIAGFIAGKFIWIGYLLDPLVIISRTVPVLAMILLAMIWLETKQIPLFVNYLMVFPLVFTEIREGYSTIDYRLLEMAKIYQLTQVSQIRHIILPSLRSTLISSLRNSSSLTWKTIIAAEILVKIPNSLGLEIYLSQYYMETDHLLALTSVIITISFFMDQILTLFSTRKGGRPH